MSEEDFNKDAEVYENVDDNADVDQPSGWQEGDEVALLSEAKASAVAPDAPPASALTLSLNEISLFLVITLCLMLTFLLRSQSWMSRIEA